MFLQYLEWSGGVIALVTAVVVGINKVKEVKARRQGLDPNPRRCLNHEDRLAMVEGNFKGISARFDGLDKRVDDVAGDVKTLLNLHLAK